MQRIIYFLLPLLFSITACSDKAGNDMLFTGMVEANTVRVSAMTAGRILQLSCDEGATVRQNDTLARIDAEKLDIQLAQQDALQKELVHRISSAEHQRSAVKVRRDNIELKLKRFRALLSNNATTQQAVDDLSAQLSALDAELQAAEASIAALRGKREQIDATRALALAQRNDAVLTSPMDGTILIRYAESGEFVGPGTPICEIGDIRRMWARIYISEKELSNVRLGQSATLRMDASDMSIPGKLEWISSTAEFTPKSILTEETRTSLVYAAKIAFDNTDGLLKIGMPVTVNIERMK